MRWWSWILLAALVLSGLVLASLSGEQPEWQQAVRWAGEREQEWRRDGCAVLTGEVTDGCSRSDYREAARLVEQWPEAVRDRVHATWEGKVAARARPEDLRIIAAAVRALRVGAYRRLDIDSGESRLGVEAMASSIDAMHLIGAFGALCMTARERAVGDPAAAVQELLDGIVSALDLASAGCSLDRVLGMSAVKLFAETFDDGLLQRCDARTLARMDTVLTLAAGALPPASDFLQRGVVHLVHFLGESDQLTSRDIGARSRWVMWRSGFSVRSYAIAALSERLRSLEHHVGLFEPREMPWPERLDALRRVAAEVSAFPCGMLEMSHVISIEHQWREADCVLAQLRQAIAFHRHLPVPRIPDPLGDGLLSVRVDGDAATFTSVDPAMKRVAVRRAR